jgi:hypothetical protein
MEFAMIRIAALILSGACLVGPAMAAPEPADLSSSSGIIPLNSLPNPSVTLASANVADPKGMIIGGVQKIILDTSGKPQTVEVALLGSQNVVQIDASRFNYDQGHNILMAQMDAHQIAAAPLAPD